MKTAMATCAVLAASVLFTGAGALAQTAASAQPSADSDTLTATNWFQQYVYNNTCPADSYECRVVFTKTPSGRVAHVTNTSCYVEIGGAQLSVMQLIVYGSSGRVLSAATLVPVQFSGNNLFTHYASNAQVDLFVPAGSHVEALAARAFITQTANNTPLLGCHISGEYLAK